MRNPFSWAVAGAATFTAAMHISHSFNAFTEGLNKFMQDVLGWARETTVNYVIGAYAAIITVALVVPELIRHVKARRLAEHYENVEKARHEHPKEFKEVVDQFTAMKDSVRKIAKDRPKDWPENERRALIDLLSDTPSLLDSLDSFIAQGTMKSIMTIEVGLTRKIIENFDEYVYADAEAAVVAAKLLEFVNPSDHPDDRLVALRRECADDHLLRRKLDTIFDRDGARYRNPDKISLLADTIGDQRSDDLSLGYEIVKALKADHRRMVEEKTGS